MRLVKLPIDAMILANVPVPVVVEFPLVMVFPLFVVVPFVVTPELLMTDPLFMRLCVVIFQRVRSAPERDASIEDTMPVLLPIPAEIAGVRSILDMTPFVVLVRTVPSVVRVCEVMMFPVPIDHPTLLVIVFPDEKRKLYTERLHTVSHPEIV